MKTYISILREINVSEQKKLFLFFLFSISFVFLKAQTNIDTTYFDKGWKITSKENRTYYRLVFNENNGFRVEDHFLNDTLQMSGFYQSLNPDIKDGTFKYYTEDGKLTSESNYSLNKKNGLFKDYSTNGELIEKGYYSFDKKEGEWTTYNSHEVIWMKSNYKNDLVDGEMTVYYLNGKVKRIESYKNGEFISGKCFAQTGMDTVFFPFEKMPEFKGGEAALNKYLAQHTSYPPNARENNIQGRVVVQFVVDASGKVTEVTTLNHVDADLEKEAINVVSKMPAWIPGEQDGKKVPVKYTLPIAFKLSP